jgi:hypothetical protein
MSGAPNRLLQARFGVGFSRPPRAIADVGPVQPFGQFIPNRFEGNTRLYFPETAILRVGRASVTSPQLRSSRRLPPVELIKFEAPTHDAAKTDSR